MVIKFALHIYSFPRWRWVERKRKREKDREKMREERERNKYTRGEKERVL